jgi:O-antigen chain-terminating methyltransferase
MTGLELECGVLDLGCGRGEWLDFLRDHGIAALGIDRNQFFLDACLKRKLRVMDADLVDFLRKVPDESIAVVTCFHVVEHMPMPVMQEVVRHIFRVLRRGGTAIFETPNPANLLTSCLSFLLDPTHLRPLHPELARFVLESSGFSAVHLEFLHPNESSRVSGNPGDPLVERFNEFFFGPQDYAAIGVKP